MKTPISTMFVCVVMIIAAQAAEEPSLTPSESDFLALDGAARREKFLDAAWRKRIVREESEAQRSQRTGVSQSDELPRIVRVPNVPNFRDIGGWTGLGGRRIRVGRIYRSAGLNDNAHVYYTDEETLAFYREGTLEARFGKDGRKVREQIDRDKGAFNFDPHAPFLHKSLVKERCKGKPRLTDEGLAFVRDVLGVRTDIDLRRDDETWGMDGSPLGPGVKWAHISSHCYGGMADAKGKDAFARCFRLFLDNANYPFVIHCIGGADRTGSLCYILEALLGVDDDVLAKDWEFTCFAYESQGFGHGNRYDKLVSAMAAYPGATTREKVEAYARDCGFTDSDIAHFRELMLEAAPERSVLLMPSAGAVVPIISDSQKKYLFLPEAEWRAGMTNETWRKAMRVDASSFPAKVAFAWNGTQGECRFEVKRVSDGKPLFAGNVAGGRAELDNFESGCEYVWTVTDKYGKSAAGRFRTEDTAPRFVRLDGVQNMRDLGGRTGLGKRRVRQGFVYRSARLEDASVEQAAALGIRTDLDLRKRDDCATAPASPLGAGVKWENVSSSAYEGIFGENGKRAFARSFSVFLDERNYPIVFHCTKGADRTGSLAYVLNALLGVAPVELRRDWEITAFFNGNVKFAHADRLDRLEDGLAAYPGETLREKAESYVRDCGFTDTDIAHFREIMLEARAPELRLAILSDPHVKDVETQDAIRRLFEYARERSVDGVLMAGDIANDGRDEQLRLVADAWFSVFPGGKDARGDKVEIVSCYGNRDMRKSSVTVAEEREREAAISIYSHPDAIWRELFGEGVGDEWCVRAVKGFPVVVVHWGFQDKLEKYWPEIEKSICPGKPFFYIQHPHPTGTVFDGMKGDRGVAKKILSAYPNAIALSGHSHRSISDERALWHGSFISLACGSGSSVAAFLDRPYENIGSLGAAKGKALPRQPHMPNTVQPKARSQIMILTLWPDRMEIERRDIGLDAPVGAPWVVPRPFRGNPAQPFGTATEVGVPQFPEGADESVEIIMRDGTNRACEPERQMVVRFPPAEPQVGGGGRAFEYEIAVVAPDGTETAKEHVLAKNYFSPCAPVGEHVECVFNAADILDGSSVRITPCNFLHQGGNAMSIGIESRTDVQDAPRTIRPGPSPTPAIAKRDDLIEAPRP